MNTLHSSEYLSSSMCSPSVQLTQIPFTFVADSSLRRPHFGPKTICKTPSLRGSRRIGCWWCASANTISKYWCRIPLKCPFPNGISQFDEKTPSIPIIWGSSSTEPLEIGDICTHLSLWYHHHVDIFLLEGTTKVRLGKVMATLKGRLLENTL